VRDFYRDSIDGYDAAQPFELYVVWCYFWLISIRVLMSNFCTKTSLVDLSHHRRNEKILLKFPHVPLRRQELPQSTEIDQDDQTNPDTLPKETRGFGFRVNLRKGFDGLREGHVGKHVQHLTSDARTATKNANARTILLVSLSADLARQPLQMKLIPAGTLRRCLRKKRVLRHPTQEQSIHSALHGPEPVDVIFL